MKKFLTKLTAILLSLTLCFGFVGCNNSQSGPPEKADLSTLVKTAVTNLFNEEYINFSLTLSQVDDDEVGTLKNTITATSNLKKTESAYDIVSITKQTHEMIYTNPENENELDETEYGNFIVGNESVSWTKFDGEIVYGDIVTVTNGLEEVSLTKADLTKLINALIGVLTNGKEVEKIDNKYTVETLIDIGEIFANAKKFVNDNKDKTLGQILVDVTGKTQEELEQAIDNTFVAGLTVSTLIDKLNALNTTLTGETKTIKQIFDTYQTYSGLSTTEIVDYVKKFVPEDSEFATYLTAPTEGQTLYDYVLAKVGELPIDALIEDMAGDEATLAMVAPIIKQFLFGNADQPALTLGQLINYVVSLIEPEAGETILQQIKALDLTGTKITSKLVIDGNGKLSSFDLSVTYKACLVDGDNSTTLANGSIAIGFNTTYGKPDGVEFAIPEAARN